MRIKTIQCCGIAALLLAFTGTACGQEDTNTPEPTAPYTTTAASSEAIPPASETEATEPETEQEPEDESGWLENEFFQARLKLLEENTTDDGYGNVQHSLTVIFAFKNKTDQTFYKNDEEILPGAVWEKKITYPVKMWEDEIGQRYWIHYQLSDADGNVLFTGGLCFEMDQELNVVNMELFSDQRA